MSAQLNVEPESRSQDAAGAATGAVRLGFLGLGWIGRKRLDAIALEPGVEVAALCDADAQRAHATQEAYPAASVASDLDALLRSEIDGVVIATPNASHAQQAIAFLERGIAVFCQKPLAIDSADTERVVEAARKSDRLLGIDYSYRHVQGMPELRSRVRVGELGEITAIDLTFHNAYGPDKAWCFDRKLSGGGCLLDLGVHLIDLVLWLQDDPRLQLVSTRLFSQGRVIHRNDRAIEDLAYAEFRQANGAVVRLACSWHAHAGCDAVIGMDIFGTRGGAAWRNVNGSFYDFNVEIFHGTARERIGTHPDEWGGRALRAWAARLRESERFDPEAIDIVRGAKLIDEIYAA